MKIQVSGTLMFKPVLGDRQPLCIEVETGTTIEGLLSILGRKLGPPFQKLVFIPGGGGVKNTVLFVLNGTPHWNLKDRLASPLQHGDTIQLSPIMTGG